MSPVKRKQVDPIEKAIEAALSPGRFIPYNAAWSFLEDVQGVADDIGKIIRKEPARAARLYEIFIAACHEKADEIDDSSGNFGMLVEELFQSWIKARQGANLDPDETAISLISWMEDDPYGFCHDLERGVVKVLDKKGVAAFIQQFRAKLESAPTRDDEEKRFSDSERRRWDGVLKTLLAALDVRLKAETLWLNLNQMAGLFERDKSVISRHLRNIYKTGELSRKATVAFFATVQEEGGRQVERRIEYFNLDAIISVGYRVNSRRGTQFRIWATNVLRDQLLKGYSLNQRRLRELRRSLRLVERVLDHYEVDSDQAKALLRVVTDYAYALDLLDDYDHQRISVRRVRKGKVGGVSYSEAMQIITQLRKTFGASALFGKEKDGSLESSLQTIMQSYDGRDLYPSLEEKAAHLLYFLTSWSKTTVSWTATNASLRRCFSGLWKRTVPFTAKMAPSGLPTTHWWPSR